MSAVAPQPGEPLRQDFSDACRLHTKVTQAAIEERDRRVQAEILGLVLRGYSMKQIRVHTFPPSLEGNTLTMKADVVAYGDPMNARKLL